MILVSFFLTPLKEQKTNVDQDPIAKKLKLDWCKISKPRIPYDEFLNETINNGNLKKCIIVKKIYL